MPKEYTVKWPLEVNPKEETFETLGENQVEDVINHNIKSTILTHKGERRGDPNFGVGAKEYLFRYNDAQLGDFSELTNDILRQVDEYVSYIIIDDIEVVPYDDQRNAIRIAIQYTIPAIKKPARFDLIISE